MPDGLLLPIIMPVTRQMRRAAARCGPDSAPPALALGWANDYRPTRPGLKGARCAVLADLMGAGMGDRVLFAQLVHGVCMAGAEVVVFYTCPDSLRQTKPQVTMQTVMKHLFPVSIASPKRIFDLEGFDYFVWMVGYRGQRRPSVLAHVTIADWARAVLGVDMQARLPTVGPASSGVPERYGAVVTSASSHAAALPWALALAVAEQQAGRQQVAVGFGTEPLPEGVLDRRNLPLVETMAIVRDAASGLSPDTGLAHVAGFYGVPWTIVAERQEPFLRWWQHYSSTRWILPTPV